MYSKSYKAKILLFGEYTIISGSHALAIPIIPFYGHWAKVNIKQFDDLRSDLIKFADYLNEMESNGSLLSDLALPAFKQQIIEGLYFKSNIPQGYGAGSSGALCAAVFERFSKKEIEFDDLTTLRKKLAQLESFFHGSSSGVDPLVSLLNRPILIESDQNSFAQLPSTENSKGAVFLLDTGIARKTEPFVHLFFKKRKSKDFLAICDDLSDFNNKAIMCFLNSQWEELFKIVHQISLIQLEYFSEMIPKKYAPIWQRGISEELFKLKLCGAGGGGFILGFTKDFEQTCAAISNEKLIPIFRF